MKVRATMLMLAVVFLAYAAVVMGGPRFVVAPAAARTGPAQLASRQPERASSSSPAVTTAPTSTPCTTCTAIRLKLAALTLLVGFTLLAGGFLGRRTGPHRAPAEVTEAGDG
jgi:hypothetical protein